jgi:hypothetical protein
VDLRGLAYFIVELVVDSILQLPASQSWVRTFAEAMWRHSWRICDRLEKCSVDTTVQASVTDEY